MCIGNAGNNNNNAHSASMIIGSNERKKLAQLESGRPQSAGEESRQAEEREKYSERVWAVKLNVNSMYTCMYVCLYECIHQWCQKLAKETGQTDQEENNKQIINNIGHIDIPQKLTDIIIIWRMKQD